MSVQNVKIDNALHWFSDLDSFNRRPHPTLRSWLTEGGLLTTRLRQRCANEFRLQLLPGAAAQSADALRRVILWCGPSPCIYAETFLPAATCAAHPWLGSLGSEPLGEALRSRPDVSRDAFEFALYSPAQLPPETLPGDTAELWARRSVFRVGQEPLTVTEIFLPAILDHGDSHVHIID